MKLSLRLTTAAVATAAALTGTATAGAVTFGTVPDETYTTFTLQNVLSPYGQEATCQADSTGEKVPGTCKQQRPDGIWVDLADLGPVMLYPLWDDPEPLFQFVPGGPEVAERIINTWSIAVGPYGRQGIFFEPATWDYIING